MLYLFGALPNLTTMHSRLPTYVLCLAALIAGSLPIAAAHASASSFSEGPSVEAVCENFVEVQLESVDDLLAANSFERALDIVNVTIQRCPVPRAKSALNDVYGAWFQHTQNGGDVTQVPDFLTSITQNEHMSASSLSGFSGRIATALSSWVGRLVDRSSMASAHRYCRQYSQYSSQTFRLNYLCGTAAYATENHEPAIRAYESIVNNWDDNQSYVQWDEAAEDLKELYMITTRFNRAFDIAKRLAIRNPTPETVLSSLITVRGQMLSPIAHHGNILFEGVTSDRIVRHVRSETERIRFPDFVIGVYMMTRDARSDVIFYDSGTIAPPSMTDLERLSGNVTMLQSTQDPDRAWLISPIDAGYFVVQFVSQTSSEENVFLENLLSDIQSERRWNRLVDQQLSRSYTATGSAVASLLSGAYLADALMERFSTFFKESDILSYFAIQDARESLVHSEQFARSGLEYGDDIWRRTSQTPALYHHEIEYNGRSTYEVVWPMYNDNEWIGVVRVGIRGN